MITILFILQFLKIDIEERLAKIESLINIYQRKDFYLLEEKNLAKGFSNYWVIGYKEGKKQDLKNLIEGKGGKIIKESNTGGNYLLAYLPLFQLIKEDFIRYFEPSVKLKYSFSPNDEFYFKYQWDKWVMYSDWVWDFEIGKKDIIVAICDQGIDYYHPDLRENFSFDLIGYDFVDNDNDPYPENEEELHGTHVAGIVAGVINNYIGISGWAQVRLLAVRVLNEHGEGSDFDVAEGIRWATDNGARIINLSLGTDTYSSVLKEAVEYAYKKGVLLIAASGNDGMANILYPAKFKEVIACGALNKSNGLAYFSNYGKEQELVAPGTEILSTIPNNRYILLDGTSMASPQICGIASLILSSFPFLTNCQLRAILNGGTIDLGDKGWDRYYGFGLLNAYYTYLIAQEYVYREYYKKIKVENQNYKKEEFYGILGNKLRNNKKRKMVYFLKKGKYFQKRINF
ncbi:MAG: S8 family peptidase [candidate division WOR-3 bacterium]|nr:S8 family peptidase [candidate division WOR-3 bacterium]